MSFHILYIQTNRGYDHPTNPIQFSLAIFEILGGGLCLVKLSMLLVISAIFTVRHVRVGAADFYGCFLPVSCMWGLDIPARRKAGLIAMFSVESP